MDHGTRWEASKNGHAVMPAATEPAVCAAEDCGHLDCTAWREAIGAPCALCGDPVQPGHTYEADFVTVIVRVAPTAG